VALMKSVASHLDTVEEKIKHIWEKYRGSIEWDDHDLTLMIWSVIDKIPMPHLTSHERKRMTNLVSIHKVRQKIQRDQPKYQSSIALQEFRRDREKEIRNYMRSKDE